MFTSPTEYIEHCRSQMFDSSLIDFFGLVYFFFSFVFCFLATTDVTTGTKHSLSRPFAHSILHFHLR